MNKLIGFLLISILFIASCKKDCTPPAIAANIIGSWKKGGSEVEFMADGTLLDPENAMILLNISGQQLDRKSYEIDGNILIIKAFANGALAFNRTAYKITKMECDKITLDYLGFKSVLRRN